MCLGLPALHRGHALGGEYGKQGSRSVWRLSPKMPWEGSSVCDGVFCFNWVSFSMRETLAKCV